MSTVEEPAADVSPYTKVPPAPPGVAKKVRIPHLLEMKKAGRPITMLTAYDATMASIVDFGGADIILVGDSLGMVVHGMETTIPVTMDMMVLHCAAVARGSRRALLVGDMPFLSYQASVEDALRNAGRLVKEGGMEAVKLEINGERFLPHVRALVESGIPVVGHVGLLPQSVNAFGGYRVQGRDAESLERTIALSLELERAGAFAIVVELMAREAADKITAALSIPTIGIGAGAGCDGQVLVLNDLLGLTENPPRFARKYLDLRAGVLRAVRKWTRDVRERTFPGPGHEFH